MATFSVILEDVTQPMLFRDMSASGGPVPPNHWEHTNQRIVTIDAVDLNDAWNQARYQYYTLKVDGPDTQIVDIEAGTITSMEELKELKAARPILAGKVAAPPPLGSSQVLRPGGNAGPRRS